MTVSFTILGIQAGESARKDFLQCHTVISQNMCKTFFFDSRCQDEKFKKYCETALSVHILKLASLMNLESVTCFFIILKS